jgi:hypothetical protein
MSASKDIVEFSTYQDVLYNGTTYTAGNYTIEPCRNATFVYEVDGLQTLSPIIIYLTTIENTSCPLEIRFCNEEGVVEKVNLTLSATFYADQASELRDNKENSSGSLVQEDVIISRPNKPANPDPTEPTEPKPTEPSEPTEPSKPTEPPKPTEPTEPSEPTQPSEPSEPTEPSTPNTEVELPIINPNAPTTPTEPEDTTPTTPPEPSEPTEPEQTTPVMPKPSEPTVPKPTEPEDEGGFFDFINNINTTYIFIAIGVVFVLLVIVVVIIIILSSRKKKNNNDDNNNPPPTTNDPSMMFVPNIEQNTEPAFPDDSETEKEIANDVANFTEDPSMLIDDSMFISETPEPVVETPIAIPEEVIEQSPVIETPVVMPIIEEVVPPVLAVKDEYEQLLLSSIPQSEIDKLKNELATHGTLEDDFSHIVQ